MESTVKTAPKTHERVFFLHPLYSLRATNYHTLQLRANEIHGWKWRCAWNLTRQVLQQRVWTLNNHQSSGWETKEHRRTHWKGTFCRNWIKMLQFSLLSIYALPSPNKEISILGFIAINAPKSGAVRIPNWISPLFDSNTWGCIFPIWSIFCWMMKRQS